jgi:hypothetical protein
MCRDTVNPEGRYPYLRKQAVRLPLFYYSEGGLERLFLTGWLAAVVAAAVGAVYAASGVPLGFV